MTGTPQIASLSFTVSRFRHKQDAKGPMVQMSWLGLVKETATRRQGPKDGPNLVFARFIPEPNGNAHRVNTKAAARTAIALDIETHKTTGEIPPSLAEAAERIKAQGWAGIVYTSHSHTAAAPRYRIILPQSAEIPPHLPAVEVVAEILGLSGVLDRSKLGPASLFYLPSAEPGGLGDHASISVDGAPIDATWIQDRAGALLAAREAEQGERREKALAAAEATRAAKIAAGFKPNENLIEAIRDRLDLAAELLRHGYTPTGNRYLYPGSETGVPGVHILRGSDGVERVFSHHANDPLAAGNLPSWCNVAAVDVVDVVTILDHGGDRKAALHKLAKQFGIESNRRQAAEPPPEWDEVPPPDTDPRNGDYERANETLSEKRKSADRLGWPDPVEFLTAESAGVPTLGPQHIPAALWPFATDTAARMGVDPTAVALCALVSAASVISDDWAVQPKRHDSTWTENARIWGAIVGDPRPCANGERRKRKPSKIRRSCRRSRSWTATWWKAQRPRH